MMTHCNEINFIFIIYRQKYINILMYTYINLLRLHYTSMQLPRVVQLIGPINVVKQTCL